MCSSGFGELLLFPCVQTAGYHNQTSCHVAHGLSAVDMNRVKWCDQLIWLSKFHSKGLMIVPDKSPANETLTTAHRPPPVVLPKVILAKTNIRFLVRLEEHCHLGRA